METQKKRPLRVGVWKGRQEKKQIKSQGKGHVETASESHLKDKKRKTGKQTGKGETRTKKGGKKLYHLSVEGGQTLVRKKKEKEGGSSQASYGGLRSRRAASKRANRRKTGKNRPSSIRKPTGEAPGRPKRVWARGINIPACLGGDKHF